MLFNTREPRSRTHKYNGVTISEIIFGDKSYFYPSFSGNLEFESLEAIKEWIDGPYSFVRKQCEWMGQQLGMTGNQVWGFIKNIEP